VKKLQIVLLSILAAYTYGVVHDQITARVCVEYFTIAHPPLFHTTSTTLLALCWGVSTTAGIGAAVGVILALVFESDGPAPCPISRLDGLFFFSSLSWPRRHLPPASSAISFHIGASSPFLQL
jgi:hypothetical protein